MPTSPSDLPQPSEPKDGETVSLESPATMILTKATETVASDDAESAAENSAENSEEQPPPAPRVWTPRPNDVLSPEDKDVNDLTDEELEDLASGGVSKGIFSGGFAITAAALGLASVTGTWLGETLFQRQQLIGNIASQNKSSAIQIANGYTIPWHKMAEVNGIIAGVSLFIAVVVLFAGQFLTARPLPHWVRAVAVAGVVLAVIGLGISFAMYFDWFTSVIKVPAAPAATG